MDLSESATDSDDWESPMVELAGVEAWVEVIATDMVVLFSRIVSGSAAVTAVEACCWFDAKKEGGCALIYIFLAQH